MTVTAPCRSLYLYSLNFIFLSSNPLRAWIYVNLINNLRGGHCFGSSRTRGITGGKITLFKLGYPVLTVTYDGECSPNVSLRTAWNLLGALPCRKKKLMTARVSMLLKSRASPDILPFSLCNKKRLGNSAPEQTPSFQRRYRFRTTTSEVCRAKDLSAPPRILRPTDSSTAPSLQLVT